ncbi:type IV secretory system conjugative DNA transfer family protein (plasmid) [Myroides odoratimimus]|uniref:type IV secretory system conjugative DNA transfer family protein n=1 Tax=Myroides odoratimimus TaxID=76832 RepID=UPI001039AA73|nr:type IV secretory system conjugative DNA transfer family protein [Myroides odoratimimus]QBK78154.1 type IV secretory system conjugative DNA transfer family protein [Myroides odoratimimus]WHT75250.1 type IV secretory system conjugative DNA transfer family protein [Myroides odoratimimus]WHU39835.1 type IV secretory system conjugative DNA transfer family protein [Myroides odoratimimus]
MNTNTIIWLVLINIIFFVVFCLATKKTKFFFLFYIGGTIYLYNLFPSYKTLIYFILPNFVLGAIISLLTKKKPLVDDIFDIKIITNQGERLLENFDRGVSIFGSSGSGKTQSAIYNFFEHFKKHDFAGCLYDYKNGELTEIIMGMFDNVEIIAPHDPSISARVNFIKPELLNDEIDINEIAKVLIMNLKGNNDKGNFFDTNAEALFTGLILKFKLDHPEYCTFPHILAFLTLNDFGGIRMVRTVDEDSGEEKIVRKWSDFKLLQDFLESNDRVRMQASAFLLGLNSENQTAGVISTLINALRQIATPNFFWVFSGDDFDLAITKENNRKIVSVINDPSKEISVTPLVASSIHSITKQMMIRHQKQAFLCIDEAPTIKLLNMARVPATMRSFNIATIYCAQDVTQGYTQYGGVNQFKEILANLSIQIFGKANDPETAKFYEQYTEIIEQEQVSVSRDGSGWMSSQKGINVSKREVRKYRQNDFQQLVSGQFVIVNNGLSEKIRFTYPDCRFRRK